MSTMFDVPVSIKQFLDDAGVQYAVIPHLRDYSAQRTAADTFTPGREFAKTVILRMEGRMAMAVLPADCMLDFEKLRQHFGETVDLATEAEIARLCPDCEVGAEPPFGALYNLPVYVARELTRDDMITFNGGTHEEAIRMRYADFDRLVRPQVIDMAIKM